VSFLFFLFVVVCVVCVVCCVLMMMQRSSTMAVMALAVIALLLATTLVDSAHATTTANANQAQSNNHAHTIDHDLARTQADDTAATSWSTERMIETRSRVREQFYAAYDSYMTRAFPHDELRPMSCSGYDTLGGYSLTLIDALDTLVILNDIDEFSKGVWWVARHFNASIDRNVSVFETNIRILGGLLSAHLFATEHVVCIVTTTTKQSK
jgi:uncharacterized membrane protein YeiB